MELPELISDSERLARFLLQKRWFSAVTNRVKAVSFIPYPHKELSASRIDCIESNEIWKLGDQVVRMRSDSVKLYARADIVAHSIRKEGLEIYKDEPPHRHANLVNWPDEKAKQKDIANELAVEATLHLR